MDSIENGKRYHCQKCDEDVPAYEVQTDGDRLEHQVDVDADENGFFPIMCGPVEEVHTVENCTDPRCEDPACKRDRAYADAEEASRGSY